MEVKFTPQEVIDLIRALSIIEGVSRTCNASQEDAIAEQLDWFIVLLTQKLDETLKQDGTKER